MPSASLYGLEPWDVLYIQDHKNTANVGAGVPPMQGFLSPAASLDVATKKARKHLAYGLS